MSINDYIRQSAQKHHWHKYYSIMRPVSIGTHPKNGMMDFINYDTGTEINKAINEEQAERNIKEILNNNGY